MVSSIPHFLYISIAFALIVQIPPSSYVEADSLGGFSVELIPRDSPKSPFYNPSETHFDRVNHAIQRSVARVHKLSLASGSSLDNHQSQMINNQGSYLISISIGTPPVRVIGLADTGSDLIWTQCAPCAECFTQKDPLYDPRKSSTYGTIKCSSHLCNSGCSTENPNGPCRYAYGYADGSSSSGTMSMDTISLGAYSTRVMFGCGYNNGGLFNEAMSGVIGLGTGPSSIISQMNAHIQGKFSYCLNPTAVSSIMNFGHKAEVSGPGAVHTRLIPAEQGTFYTARLEAISVGTMRIEAPQLRTVMSSSNDPNVGSLNDTNAVGMDMVIDSGTTLTYLPRSFYDQIESAMMEQINHLELMDYDNELVKLCYKTPREMIAPDVTVHFAGADVKLSATNTFTRVNTEGLCFTFTPTEESGTPVYGNMAQMNFMVGHDIQKKVLSFKPANCTGI